MHLELDNISFSASHINLLTGEIQHKKMSLLKKSSDLWQDIKQCNCTALLNNGIQKAKITISSRKAIFFKYLEQVSRI